MKTLLILTVLFTVQAYASGSRDEEPTTQTQTQDQSMDQAQHQTAISEGSTATGGDATANGGDGGTGTGGNVGDISTSINYKRPYRNAPNSYAPPIAPTVPCFKGASGSASAPGFGLSLGGGKIDQGCVRRELIRLAPESHKLYLFCNEPTILAMFDDFQTCLDYSPKGGDLDDSGPDVEPAYDAAVFREEIEAALSDVREELRQTKAEVGAVQKRSAAPRVDHYAAMHARVMAQTKIIE